MLAVSPVPMKIHQQKQRPSSANRNVHFFDNNFVEWDIDKTEISLRLNIIYKYIIKKTVEIY